MPQIAAAGIGDEVFINQLRDDIEDAPQWWNETFSGNTTQTVFPLAKKPVYDVVNSLDFPLTVSVGGTPYTIKQSRADLSGGTDVMVEFATGRLFFYTAPGSGSGNISVNHYSVNFLNRMLLRRLNDGLSKVAARIMADKTGTFTLAVNQWEYSLPSDFLDPRCSIYKVEVQEIPASTEQFHPLRNWTFGKDMTTIRIPQSQWFTPGAVCRVRYYAPYSSLADLEAYMQYLPVLYAKAILLLNKEIVRARFDQGAAPQSEQANPPGASSNIGFMLLQQFETAVAELARQRPHRLPPPALTYAL